MVQIRLASVCMTRDAISVKRSLSELLRFITYTFSECVATLGDVLHDVMEVYKVLHTFPNHDNRRVR